MAKSLTTDPQCMVVVRAIVIAMDMAVYMAVAMAIGVATFPVRPSSPCNPTTSEATHNLLQCLPKIMAKSLTTAPWGMAVVRAIVNAICYGHGCRP